jgi:hypothetical protein
VPPSPTHKLNRAINEENARFIGSELENQQQVVRWASSYSLICAWAPPLSTPIDSLAVSITNSSLSARCQYLIR